MAGLDKNTSAFAPLIVTARLEQGIVLDSFYGLALDGLLASLVRRDSARALGLRPDGGQDLDGGLHVDEPVDWQLPLAQCVPDNAPEDWHWMCSVGYPLDLSDEPITDRIPDPHRLSVRLDSRRAHQISVKVPSTAGGASGRFRTRITPVLAIPAAAIRWKAVGDLESVQRLLHNVSGIGGRRGVGEGAVTQWSIQEASGISDAAFWVHHDLPMLGPSRPLPLDCAEKFTLRTNRQGVAGLRPPLLHRSRQRLLVLPSE